MTPITDHADIRRPSDTRAIALVSAAHFVSHFYIIVLAPLFAFIRADFGVSYTELGAAISIFNIVSAVLQPPAGILVDRVSARGVLIGGLVLGATALALAALAPVFWLFVAMFALAGLANTVYHPADYALLSQHVSGQRMSQAYSIHTFAGMLGTAVAPATLLAATAAFGWRGALISAALLGYVVAGAILFYGDALAGSERARATKAAAAAPDVGWRVLLSTPIVMNLVFFITLAMIGTGIQNFSVVALEALHGTPLSVGNVALTANLFFSGVGVLVGGVIAGRTARHAGVASLALLCNAVAIAIIAVIEVGAAALMALMALGGFFNGLVLPSRDMLVRAVTPPGAYGTVFGFVTTGLHIGGIFAPIMFGWLMDHGSPRAVLIGAAVCCLACIPLVLMNVLVRR